MLTTKLKELRTGAKLSQKELAATLGLDYKRYNHYETGRSEPDIATLHTLADFFNVTIDYLLGRDSEQKNNPDTAEDAGNQEIYSILSELTPENQEKLLELARMYRASQQRPEDK